MRTHFAVIIFRIIYGDFTFFHYADDIYRKPKSISQGINGNKIDEEECKEIVVKIERNIPGAGPSTKKLKRDIVHPEDITIKRRHGMFDEKIEFMVSFNSYIYLEESKFGCKYVFFKLTKLIFYFPKILSDKDQKTIKYNKVNIFMKIAFE